ncbi:MAG: hypothetical protein M1819_004327 [Sarea resinae]|nr:MAG: hypothetical protein M1819_004327 [Sarea resinae]
MPPESITPEPKAKVDQSATDSASCDFEPKTNDNKAKASQKRKASPPTSTPSKHPRQQSPGSTEKDKKDETSSTSSLPPQKLIAFLLTPQAISLSQPSDEQPDQSPSSDAKPTKQLKTYSSLELSPFEELLSAVILSRPISHRLGHRSIRTLLNPPWDFNTAAAVRDAGQEKVHEALDEARTQHKEKTALELIGLAEVLLEKFPGASGTNEEDKKKGDTDAEEELQGDDISGLEDVRVEAGYDVEKEREFLRTSIKGLGPTGLDIFFRRVQAVWKEAYPFIDGRTAASVEKLGLPADAEGLKSMMEEFWDDIRKVNGVEVSSRVQDGEKMHDDEAKRKAFVRVLETAVGSDLEGKIEDVKVEAGKFDF